MERKMKSVAATLERVLKMRHDKKTEQYQYKKIIKKEFYFGAEDAVMHILRGFMSVADGRYCYHLKFVFRMASDICDKFYNKQITIKQAKELAFEQGQHLYYNNYGETPL
jgi:hypothetical protein